MKRLENMINKEDREEIMKLGKKADEAQKKLDDLNNKMVSKIKNDEKIQNEKLRTNNWIKHKKISDGEEVCRSDDDKEKIITIDKSLQKAIDGSNYIGVQLQELKEKIIYFLKAAKLITEKQKCSANLLCNELKINKNNAYYIINKLEEAGLILDIYGKLNQEVIIENQEMLEVVLTATDLVELFSDQNQEEGK